MKIIDSSTISIVIPAYFAENFIERTIKSCLNQKNVNLEIIVVEDGVFDNTASIVKSFNDDRVRLISLNNNQGAQIARNTGLRFVKSKYVVFLDSDDFLEGNFLFELYKTIEKNKSDFVIGSNKTVHENSTQTSTFSIPLNTNEINLLEGWLVGNLWICPNSIMWNTSSVKKIGGWNEKMFRNQDGELVIRALLKGLKFTVSKAGFGCSFNHNGHRVSRLKNFESFDCQKHIVEQVSEFLKPPIPKNIKLTIKNALNYFRLNVILGALEHKHFSLFARWYREWLKETNCYLPRTLPLRQSLISFFCLTFGPKIMICARQYASLTKRLKRSL